MLEIRGKVNTAICFARIIEDEAIAQIRRMCDTEMTRGSRIRIMSRIFGVKISEIISVDKDDHDVIRSVSETIS